MNKPVVTLIAALGRNNAIGRENQLLWRLPEDLKRFKALTMGSPIIMGRKTFESVGRVLPGRRNLVLTHQSEWQFAGAERFSSLDEAIAACSGVKQIFVIGGAQIYSQALALADVLELTEVDDAPQCDACFPQFDRKVWQELQRETHTDPASGLRYDFVRYQRVVL